MKKLLALLLAGCMAFALCACGTPAEPAEEGGEAAASGDTIVIGVYEPLSGDNGAGGKQEVLGMQYANAVCPTVEIDGTTYNVVLEIADNESSNDKAVSAANTLIAKSPSVILGSYGSGVSIAAADTFGAAGVPAIGVTCTNPQVTEGNEHYFRICFLDPFQGTVLANFAKDELGATKVYCIGQLGNDYDQGLINYFKEAAEAAGIECVVESFPENNSDFNSYLTNAKNAGCDAIFAPTSISYAQLIVEQAAAQGKDLSIYVSTFYAEGGDPDFETGIKEWINADQKNLENNGGNDMLAAVTVMGYDAYFTALKAIKNAGSIAAADVLAALPATTYTGVSGSIGFNEIGDAVRDSAFIKNANVENNVWDFVAVQGVQ
ncbi:MAG: ABC transporter substrate-binding protein [Ruminiclostridium sp.]|nr:ABC transporter substrate-binding protein [Ruminiclostridium sp.]